MTPAKKPRPGDDAALRAIIDAAGIIEHHRAAIEAYCADPMLLLIPKGDPTHAAFRAAVGFVDVVKEMGERDGLFAAKGQKR